MDHRDRVEPAGRTRRGRFALVALGAVIVAALAATPAAAAPTLGVTASCTYSGGRFAVSGKGFEPNASVILEVMGMPDPRVGAPLQALPAMADAQGTLLEVLDVPPTLASSPVMRSVRARSPADEVAAPVVLAAAPLRTVSRGVQVSADAAGELVAGTAQRWQLTGLPEGTPLYAHYRRRGRTVARRSLGTAADPCGRLSFDLPVLPRGEARSGPWEVWMTADRTFRRRRKGVFVRRRLTVDGSTARARVRGGAPVSRLTPLDARFTAPATNGMAADATRIGLISLIFVGARGALVEFLERVGDRLVRLGTSTAGPAGLSTVLMDATTWSCDRVDRRFVATATLPSGEHALATYSVRTPSCASRFELAAPRRVEPDALARIRIVDRWGTGAIAPTLCVTPPAERRRCRRVAFGRAVSVASHRLRATKRGAWRVQLRVRDRRVRSAVMTVGGARAAAARLVPTVLATGDSTMQGIDAFLADELGETASVVSDVRPGTGISRSGQPSLPGARDAAAIQWALLARQQTRRRRQRTTIVSVGAADGFPMITPQGARVGCCDASGSAEYRRRVRLMMRAYTRGGRRVLWLTVPLPRDDRRLVISRFVNGAILDAAKGLPRVKVVRMDLLFTPDGYRNVMRYRGRDVDVRDVDGIHLNVAGTAIAAKVVAEELRTGTD